MIKRHVPTSACAAGRSIEFVQVVNMLNVDKITSFPMTVLAEFSPSEWIENAWNAAVDGLMTDPTHVVKIESGIWFIQCHSMQAVARLQAPGKIIARLHRIHQIRELPSVRGFIALPPIGVGTPMQMIRSLPIESMPSHIWQAFAWHISVDPGTAKSTSVTGISQGIWQIRCDSQHAWDFLQNPEPTLGMLRWLSQFKALPDALALDLRLGNIVPSHSQTLSSAEQDIMDDPDIPPTIKDPDLRRILAKLRPR